MTFVLRWAGGEDPKCEVAVATNFVASSAHLSGPYSQLSYLAHFTAAGQKFEIKPDKQDGKGGQWDGTSAVAHSGAICAIYPTGLPADPILIMVATGTVGGAAYNPFPVLLEWNTVGTLTLYSGDGLTSYATAANPISVGAYTYLRYLYDCDDVARTIRVRVSTATLVIGPWTDLIDYTLTGVPGTGLIQVQVINFEAWNIKGIANPAIDVHYEDLLYFAYDNEADIPNFGFEHFAVAPDAVSSVAGESQFDTGAGASPHPDVTNVDDILSGGTDDATTYDDPTATGQKKQLYTLADTYATPVGFSILSVVSCIRENTPAANTARMRVRENGVTQNNPNNMIADGTWRGMTWRMDTPPSGGSWDDARINATEIGMQRVNTLAGASISTAYVMVIVRTVPVTSLPSLPPVPQPSGAQVI